MVSNVWQAMSGDGWASGGASASWAYSGGGGYTQTGFSGAVAGTVDAHGHQDYHMSYDTTATLPPDGTLPLCDQAWVQTGTGDVWASSYYDYSYAGSGGGSIPSGSDDEIWTVSDEHGGGGGTATYDCPLTLAGGAWSGADAATCTGTAEQNDYCDYHDEYKPGEVSGFSTTIHDNQRATVTIGGWGDGFTASTSFSGSGSGTYIMWDGVGHIGGESHGSWSPDSGDPASVSATETETEWNYQEQAYSTQATTYSLDHIPSLWAGEYVYDAGQSTTILDRFGHAGARPGTGTRTKTCAAARASTTAWFPTAGVRCTAIAASCRPAAGRACRAAAEASTPAA